MEIAAKKIHMGAIIFKDAATTYLKTFLLSFVFMTWILFKNNSPIRLCGLFTGQTLLWVWLCAHIIFLVLYMRLHLHGTDKVIRKPAKSSFFNLACMPLLLVLLLCYGFQDIIIGVSLLFFAGYAGLLFWINADKIKRYNYLLFYIEQIMDMGKFITLCIMVYITFLDIIYHFSLHSHSFFALL